MNAKRFGLTLIAVCLSLSVAEQASAYYAAQMGRWTTRDPNGEIGRNGMETPPGGGMAIRFVGRDRFDPMAQYSDGMNLYQYVRSSPAAHTDPSGEVSPDFDPISPTHPIWPGGPIPTEICRKNVPCKNDSSPWDIFEEANRRRHSQGPNDESSHHCWAACMLGKYGLGVGGLGAAIIETGTELIPGLTWGPDSPQDIGQNFKGAGCGATGSSGCPDDDCDACCGTRRR